MSADDPLLAKQTILLGSIVGHYDDIAKLSPRGLTQSEQREFKIFQSAYNTVIWMMDELDRRSDTGQDQGATLHVTSWQLADVRAAYNIIVNYCTKGLNDEIDHEAFRHPLSWAAEPDPAQLKKLGYHRAQSQVYVDIRAQANEVLDSLKAFNSRRATGRPTARSIRSSRAESTEATQDTAGDQLDQHGRLTGLAVSREAHEPKRPSQPVTPTVSISLDDSLPGPTSTGPANRDQFAQLVSLARQLTALSNYGAPPLGVSARPARASRTSDYPTRAETKGRWSPEIAGPSRLIGSPPPGWPSNLRGASPPPLDIDAMPSPTTSLASSGLLTSPHRPDLDQPHAMVSRCAQVDHPDQINQAA